MFRIRYFPPGSLSFEPLGTMFIMHRDGSRVKAKSRPRERFHQKIKFVESRAYAMPSVNRVWIKRAPPELFDSKG
jgi:hypothetical protein